MPRSKEISEDIRRKVVEAHESGKGYKLISKAIGLPKTTIRAILRKWKRFGTVVTLPRSGRPSKISPRARGEIIREVMKNPCTTSKDLQATLASANICVHQSTIRRILGIHGRPTLSSFEGSIALQTSGQEEEGMLNTSDGSSRDLKSEEEGQVLKHSNAHSDHGSKGDAKCPDNNKEGAGHGKSCGDGEKRSTNNNGDDKNRNRNEEMQLVNMNGAGDGNVETHHNCTETEDGGDESEKCDHGGNGAETNLNSRGGVEENKKSDVEAAISGGNRHDTSYATGRDINSAYSNNNNSKNHNNNNNNNNNNDSGGNWSEEVDYISTLTFS